MREYENQTEISETENETCRRRCSHYSIKSSTGLFAVLLLAVSVVLEGQFVRDLTSGNFTAIAFATWYSRSWTIICYPIYCPIGMLFGKSLKDMWKEDSVVLQYQGQYLKGFIFKIIPVTIFLTGTYGFFFYAVKMVSLTDYVTILSVNIALIYILSVSWLREPVILIRTMAIFIAIGGVLFYAGSYKQNGSNELGIVITLISALMSALYRVYLKKVLPDASISKTLLLLTAVSLTVMLSGWIFVLIFTATEFESINWDLMPWDTLNLTSALSVAIIGLTFLGTAISYPIYVAIGLLLGIPGNAIVDNAIHQIAFDNLKIVGAILISFSFLILLIPEDKAINFSKRITTSFTKLMLKCGQNDVLIDSTSHSYNNIVSSSSSYFFVDSKYNSGIAEASI
ncbi:uncharacterized protein TRIADDRAFT_64328 [Trichoplax adhaerens]|uniref:EamA domain-containing protein n=1 Tax=Trichoplax adhaerens TaxID=10228 RepID=B3SA95_TRIAD|nr:hypothetical protein TRIADDRAFT_64328 [Trichoplax adhaerens]EDV20476.1 hypothetical protein TRIADDRAFT_64328 [Trichoplax adhaerens]|eukprot:XP_002117170.1 hypothetical protein TRIADDRAFT_64328 [Trichoplax adhaerens]